MSEERRRSIRLNLELTITLVGSAGTHVLRAREISEAGMFIRTDQPQPMRHLVRLQVPIDHDGNVIHVLAMVVRHVPPAKAKADGVAPGMGVQLYGLGPAMKQRWQEWVTSLIERYGESESTPDTATPTHTIGIDAPAIDAVHRDAPRYLLALDVRLGVADGEEAVTTRDISTSGAFVYTKNMVALGERVRLSFTHPKTNKPFEIDAVVVRHEQDPTNQAGIGVVYVDVDT